MPAAITRAWKRWIPAHVPDQAADLDRDSSKADLVLLILLSGFLLGVAFHYLQGVYRELGYPHNTFLFRPEDRFNDFFNLLKICRNLNPYHEPNTIFPSNYPPFANLFFYWFSLLPGKRLALLIYVAVPCAVACAFVSEQLRRLPLLRRAIYTLGIVALGEPFLIAIDRANLELWVLVCVAVFAYAYPRGTKASGWIAAVALAVAINFKIYPVFLLLIFIKDRRFWTFFLALAVTISLALAGAVFHQGGILVALRDCAWSLGRVSPVLTADFLLARFNLGLFNAVHVFAVITDAPAIFSTYAPRSGVISLLVVALISAGVLFRRMALWQSITALFAAGCLAPALSNDYKAASLIVPLAMLLATRTPRLGYIAAAGFALLMVPKHYQLIALDVSTASLINPLLIIGLCICVIAIKPPAANGGQDRLVCA